VHENSSSLSYDRHVLANNNNNITTITTTNIKIFQFSATPTLTVVLVVAKSGAQGFIIVWCEYVSYVCTSTVLQIWILFW
jgi:hypothetical protein